MQGKATVAGHPIHPMLVTLPIGLFSGAFVSDVIAHWGDPVFWPRMSVALIGFGLLAGLAAALFGFVDYVTAPMPDAAKKTATAHMVVNLTVIAIFAIAFWVRLGDNASVLGQVLTAAGVVLLGISGFLGGHLAYHFGVGVESMGSPDPS